MDWERDIYDWQKGCDDEDIRVLNCLNAIIHNIYELEGVGWDYIYHRMNVMLDYQKQVDKVLEEFDLIDFACALEVIRALLIGGKIDYEFLAKHMNEAVHKYGYIPQKEETEDE